jgi:hypothetical protein
MIVAPSRSATTARIRIPLQNGLAGLTRQLHIMKKNQTRIINIQCGAVEVNHELPYDPEPHLIEVIADKKVVRVLQDWKDIGHND